MDYAQVIVNLGYFLMLCAFLARDVLWLRSLLVLGQGSVTLYALHVNALPIAIWNAVFMLINLLQVILILRERRGVAVPPELREFYEQTFAALAPGEFLNIWKRGVIETRGDDGSRDALLVREGEYPDRLFFLLDGQVEVQKSGRGLAQLARGRFVADMSFLTGEAASADVLCRGAVRYVAWDSAQLRKLRVTRPVLWTKLLSALGKDLVDKIKAASTTAA